MAWADNSKLSASISCSANSPAPQGARINTSGFESEKTNKQTNNHADKKC